MKGASVTMFVRNTVHNDNRVLKEARTLAEAGYRVTVIGLRGEGLKNDERYGNVRIVRVDGAGTTRRRIRDEAARREGVLSRLPGEGLAQRAALGGNRFLWRAQNVAAGKLEPLTYLWDFFQAASQAVDSVPSDVWFAHDLNTLPVALWMRAKLGGKLIYDSHEYWLDCNNVYTPFAKSVWTLLERSLIGKADAVITVSDGIAAALGKRYGIAKPEVILNTPVAADLAAPAPSSGTGKPAVAVYVGRITRQRGYETVIRALELVRDVELVCYGHGDEGYIRELRSLSESLGLSDRVRFAGSVSPTEIQPAIAAADLGIVAVQGGALSYEYCLPSKLFEYAFAGLPVVSSDLPELRNFVRTYGLGVCVDVESPAAIAEGIVRVLESPSSYRSPESRAKLRARYDWRIHGQDLVRVIEKLGFPAPGLEAA